MQPHAWMLEVLTTPWPAPPGPWQVVQRYPDEAAARDAKRRAEEEGAWIGGIHHRYRVRPT